jgi:hypothetical protein
MNDVVHHTKEGARKYYFSIHSNREHHRTRFMPSRDTRERINHSRALEIQQTKARPLKSFIYRALSSVEKWGGGHGNPRSPLGEDLTKEQS